MTNLLLGLFLRYTKIKYIWKNLKMKIWKNKFFKCLIIQSWKKNSFFIFFDALLQKLEIEMKEIFVPHRKGRKNLSRNSNALNYNKKDSFFSSLRLIFEKWNIKKNVEKNEQKNKKLKTFLFVFHDFYCFCIFCSVLKRTTFFLFFSFFIFFNFVRLASLLSSHGQSLFSGVMWSIQC